MSQATGPQIPMIFRVFWIAPIITGLLLMMLAGKNIREAEASAQWKTTTATVIRVGGQSRFFTSQRWGSYRWMRDGREYTGSEIDCCGSKWDRYFELAGEKKTGDEIIAYLDPDDPARAVLMTGNSGRCLIPFSGGVALILLGWWIRQRITRDATADARGF